MRMMLDYLWDNEHKRSEKSYSDTATNARGCLNLTDCVANNRQAFNCIDGDTISITVAVLAHQVLYIWL